MGDRLILSGWQQFVLLLAGPALIAIALFFWYASRAGRGSRMQRRKRKRKRF
jgi:cyanate permease